MCVSRGERNVKYQWIWVFVLHLLLKCSIRELIMIWKLLNNIYTGNIQEKDYLLYKICYYTFFLFLSMNTISPINIGSLCFLSYFIKFLKNNILFYCEIQSFWSFERSFYFWFIIPYITKHIQWKNKRINE